jgi:hypothetical protein
MLVHMRVQLVQHTGAVDSGLMVLRVTWEGSKEKNLCTAAK